MSNTIVYKAPIVGRCCICAMLIMFFHGITQVNIFAQSNTVSELQVKAVFLYNFTHFIDWPESAFESKYDSFIIGVVGNDPITPLIEQAIKGEWIETHVIRLQRFRSVDDIDRCHILYVSSDDPDEVKEIIRVASRKKILTVGDTPNFVRWGGLIRFYTDQGKLRLQINNTIAKAEGFKISSKLLRVADVL